MFARELNRSCIIRDQIGYQLFHDCSSKLSVGNIRNINKGSFKFFLNPKYKLKKNDVTHTKFKKSLTRKDIESINDYFLKRTKGLEPDATIKQLDEISKEFHERFDKRYLEPSKEWLHCQAKHVSVLKIPPTFQFNFDTLWNIPLQIGDLVLLKSHPHELSMCVGLPHSVTDPRYTFVTINGTIIFHPKNQIHLRIPHKLPKDIKSLIQKESDHGYDSIGTIRDKIGSTVILPSVVREKLTSIPTSKITRNAWLQLPIVIKKLKLLNRWLQKDEKPYQISFPYLVKLVEKLDLNKYKDQNYLKQLTVGTKNLNNNNIYINLNASTFLATYWGVKEQQTFNMWGDLHINSAILSPISVTILPIESRQLFYHKLLQRFSENNHKAIDKFITLVETNQYDKISNEFEDIIRVLEDYSSGNFVKNIKNNPIVTIISTIFRKLPKYQNKDITKDVCFELLQDICPDYKYVNPLLNNLHVRSQIEKSAPIFDLYRYDENEELFEKSSPFSQLYKEINCKRVDYTKLPVYCIDSELAHEIDDGISIMQRDDNLYTLYIHIADPVSVFPESLTGNHISSPLLKIALEKAFTTYLPDIVDPMLPKSITQLTGMGTSGKNSRAITFSVDATFINERQFKILDNTFKIELSYVSHFPKVTYNTVDQILSNDKNFPASSSMKNDLDQMSKIARELRKYRINEGNAVIFGEGFNRGLVQLESSSGKIPHITFKNQIESPSTILVSEFMILANRLTGNFFKQNNIPGVFRTYNDLSLGPIAYKSYARLQEQTRRGHIPDITDVVKLSSLLNSSVYSSSPLPHKMIGVSSYLTVTSPLRRMPDLINHIQIHRYLNRLGLAFQKKDIDSMLWGLQSRADIIKSLANNVSSYWTLKYLKNKVEQNSNQWFEVLVTSYPFDGKVHCVFPEMTFARGILKIPTNTPHPKIGTRIKNCKIVNIDCLENNLELEIEQNSCK
ncbi:exoribonuclease II PWA37_000665 [Arxiozyma heterogenica]|uniref:RNB domain-containing protein n=1 Tax=Arxiozyma heterogenica TaxID=278026 RepID=A0AAN7WQP5_9SACH|nr:hypothetical protein RI543_000553 [Kazachstania heterogenica]